MSKNVRTIFLDKIYFNDYFMYYFMPLKFCWYLYKQRHLNDLKFWFSLASRPKYRPQYLNTKFWFWGPLIYTYLCINFQLNRRLGGRICVKWPLSLPLVLKEERLTITYKRLIWFCVRPSCVRPDRRPVGRRSHKCCRERCFINLSLWCWAAPSMRMKKNRRNKNIAC